LHTFIRVFSSRLSPAFIGSNLFTTTDQSATCSAIDSAFPFGLYLFYLAYVRSKEPTELPPVIYTFCSIHPDPNHVNEPCRSFPFFLVFLQDVLGTGFPVFQAGHPTLPPPLVHITFRAGLCLQTFWIPPHRGHPVNPSHPREDFYFGYDTSKGKVIGWI